MILAHCLSDSELWALRNQTTWRRFSHSRRRLFAFASFKPLLSGLNQGGLAAGSALWYIIQMLNQPHFVKAGGFMTLYANRSLLRLCGLMIAILALSGCARGPFSPEVRRQSAELERYMNVLQAALVTDDTFEWNTLSSALIVRALKYSGPVRSEAEHRYAGAPPFEADTAQWLKPVRRSGRPIVILMGIFTPDLKEKDITTLGRFRPRLMSPDGRAVSPLEIKRYGRDAVFMRDYFPIFNPWEEVYMLKFPSTGLSAGTLDFILEWPGGVQVLTLENY